jgi:hypothetical protein
MPPCPLFVEWESHELFDITGLKQWLSQSEPPK